MSRGTRTSLLRSFYLFASTCGDLVLELGGPGAEKRICPGVPPQDSKGSYVCYQRISSEDDVLLSGKVTQQKHSILQIDVWASDPDKREALVEIVREIMRRWLGQWGDLVIERVPRKILDVDGIAETDDASGERDWRTTLRYHVWHRNLKEVA